MAAFCAQRKFRVRWVVALVRTGMTRNHFRAACDHHVMDIPANKHVAMTVRCRDRVVVEPVANQRQRRNSCRDLLAGVVGWRQGPLERGKICRQLDAHETSPCSRAFSSASLMHLCSGKRCNLAPALTCDGNTDHAVRPAAPRSAPASLFSYSLPSGRQRTVWAASVSHVGRPAVVIVGNGKQHAHRRRAGQPHRRPGVIPRALRPDSDRTLVASDRMARIDVLRM